MEEAFAGASHTPLTAVFSYVLEDFCGGLVDVFMATKPHKAESIYYTATYHLVLNTIAIHIFVTNVSNVITVGIQLIGVTNIHTVVLQ